MPHLIIDLDHTLLDTTRFKADLAKSVDLTQADWDMAYNKFVADYGMFNATDFLKGVTAEQKKQFEMVVQKTSSFLYPDSLSFLKRAVQAGYQIIVLTFGNQTWQQQKLDHITWPPGVTVLTTDSKKITQLAQYRGGDTLVVDDRGQELDAIAQSWSNVKLYWMRRPNGKYRDVAPVAPHREITSLSEVPL